MPSRNDTKSKKMNQLGIGIIGTGRVGRALAVNLARAGWRISGVNDLDSERSSETARIVPTGSFDDVRKLVRRSDILFLTVPDSEIARLAESLGEIEKFRARFVFHVSGILPAKVLQLAGLDRAVYSLHPFGGIPENSNGVNPFCGLYFSGEGDDAAKPIARDITSSLGGEFIPMDAQEKVLYHLAASLVANHIFALFSSGEELLEKAGISHENVKPMVIEMARKALENYTEKGLVEGLTGPVTRGDELTIAEHIIAAEHVGRRELYEAGLVELRKILGLKIDE